MSLSAIPREIREAVRNRDANACQYCRLVQYGQGATFHINHIIPRAKGGVTRLDNLVLQCPYCSLHKADKIRAVDSESATEVNVFHPLRDKWNEHFSIAADGRCAGITAVGRATCDALRMNDPIPRLARAFQLAQGLIKTPR